MDFKQFYKTINFDIDNEIRTVYQVTQGDTKSRGLLVDLIVDGDETPVTTEKMNFFALKPDGTRVMTAGVKDGDKFRIDFTNQTFAVPGVLLCSLVLYGTNGEKIADKKFKMTVDSSLEDGAIVSEDERGILDRAFDLANDIVPRLEALDVPLLENAGQEVAEIKGAEALRVSAEISRATAEQGRVTAETGRTTAETGRANAESARVTAELGRAAALDAAMMEANQRIDNLVTTPVPTGEIIAEEIIDARDGEASVGAKIRNIDAQLAENTKIGDNVGRFINRARAGENLKITALGDSILEGTTVTNPLTDGAIIKLAEGLASRFGVTVSHTNFAHSGDTAMRSSLNGWVKDAINDNADLYVISAYDKNDLGQDINGQWSPGYNMQSSLAAIERMIREIKRNVPKADIILMSTNPYSGAAISANPYQLAKDDAVKQLAAIYGCEWVDCYAEFIKLGDWSALMAEDTHPNTAGHALIAETLLSHFPNYEKTSVYQGEVSTKGKFNPETVDINQGNFGYALVSGPSTLNGVTYTCGGTGWADEVTSTVGDYVEVQANAVELAIQMSNATVDNPVVDIYIDDVLQEADVNLSQQGKLGTYWIPFATGLEPNVNHKLKLVLKSGTLRTFTVSGLMSATYQTDTKVLVVFSGSPSYVLATSFADVIPDVRIAMPSGWNSMDMEFDGVLTFRSNGAVDAIRLMTYNIKVDAQLAGLTQMVSFYPTVAQAYMQVPIGVTRLGVESKNPTIQIQASINDATNIVRLYSMELRAKLTRTS